MTYKFALIRNSAVEEIREFADLEKVAVNKLGPDGNLLLRPLIEGSTPTVDERLYRLVSEYVIESESVTRQWNAVQLSVGQMIDLVRSVTRTKIESGFTSSALGAPHLYPSNETDQQNMTANVVSAMVTDLPTLQLCADANSVWDYREHTPTQIKQVGLDAKAHILACLVRSAELRAVAAAGGAPQIDDGWPA